MEKIFTKKLTKKGFTLAELLIVVAIIAILAAIAAPLFMGALDKAEKAVFESNKRAVKSAGMAKILLDSATDTTKEKWYVKGTFDETTGDLKEVAIDTSATGESNIETWKSDHTITVELTKTDLNLDSTGAGG